MGCQKIGVGYGMEMDMYKSQFLDGHPDMDMVQCCTVSYLGLKRDPNFLDLGWFFTLVWRYYCTNIYKFYIAEFCVSVIITFCPVPPFVTVILSHHIITLQFHQSSSSAKL